MTKFYIELPGDAQGNIAHPAAVIEARIVQGGTPEAGIFATPGREVIIYDSPPEVLGYVGSYTDQYGGYAEVDGPARMLSRDEHRALVAKVRS